MEPGTDQDRVGLCGSCRHARVIQSARRSTFYLCRRSETDLRFAKYPPLPVWTCIGYEAAAEKPPASEDD